MKHRQHALLAAALAAGVTFALGPTGAAAFAGDNVSALDPGFVPNSGQINRGFDEKVPTSSQPRPIPTPAQARAAKMMPYQTQPSVGVQQAAEIPATDAMRPETKDGQATAGGPEATNASADAMHNGAHDASGNRPRTAATAGAAPHETVAAQAPGTDLRGPIGATGQTMPAKLSERNDVLDRVPIMAQPLSLSDQDRQRIFQAVMADKTPAASDAVELAPASELTTNLALNETHPLPASVRGIGGLQALGYVKTKSKVFLVEPATRIVVDEIGS